jgi:hypothetical protein
LEMEGFSSSSTALMAMFFSIVGFDMDNQRYFVMEIVSGY